jgi:beta-galactosidase
MRSATKSEIRNPKSERSPKSEIRNVRGRLPDVRFRQCARTAFSDFDFRISFGFRISDFGFRHVRGQRSSAIGLGLAILLAGLVHHVCLAADTISLAGKWRFALDRADAGIDGRWFNRDLAYSIDLPGVLQSQGYGDEISISTPWVLSLYDKQWYLRDDYQAYTNAGSVKVPFVCQPPRHYLGVAWYQRDVNIPADWKERRLALFLERPRWETRVWLDDQLVGTNNSLCAPHEFDLGTISPGKHRLSVRVDNRMILPYRLDAHAVSDSLNSTWNGMVGRLELQAYDRVAIRGMRLQPDLDRKGVEVTLEINNAMGKTVTAPMIVQLSTNATKTLQQTATIEPGDSKLTFFYLMPTNFVRWSEFNPKLYELRVSISGTGFRSEVMDTFGMREIRADGQDFILNGQKIYLRGTHMGGDFPLTGYPPTQVSYWKKIIRTCQMWGLNHMRFHSFCPPEAAFIAADELGFYLQPECGMWNTFSPGSATEKMLYAETDRMLKAYGNHPSFLLLSASNEAGGAWKQCLPQWVDHYLAEDPRHLYTPDTGWSLIDVPGPVQGADYLAVGRIGLNRVRGEPAWFGGDYGRSVRGVNVPVVSHEVGQWCAYPDYDVIKKFTGYMRPGNYEIFRDSMAAHGLLEKNKDFAWASGRFQLECYKEEIEANLRTPGLAGFQLLDLHEYVGQGTALVGLLDPFWEEKSYASPSEFRTYCGPVVPLARLTRRVFNSSETLSADVDVANYSGAPLEGPKIKSRITFPGGDSGHAELWEGSAIPIGKSFSVRKISAPLNNFESPGACTLEITIVGKTNTFQNSWKFWVYPAQVSNSVPKDVLMTSSWDEAEAKLAAGGKVLYLPRNADLDWSSPPLADLPVFWNRLMNPAWGRMLGLWCDTNHPALAEFPTEPNCDWQWTQIIRGVRAVNLDRLPRGLQPIVQAIDDWNRNWKLGAIFECKVGPGRLMVCSFDLERDLDNRIVARQLRRSLLDYMASEKFQPKTEVSAAEFRTVLFDTRIMRKLNAAAAGDGTNANAAIDGDPNTFWIAGAAPNRNTAGTPYPHNLTVRFPEPVAMEGLVIMPRQNDRDHLGDVRTYTIEVSDDGEQWRVVTSGQLASTWAPQRLAFPATITAKELRFTASSGFGRDTSAALAELAVLYGGPKLGSNDSGTVEYRRSRSTSTDVEEGGDAPVPRTNSVPRNP